MKTKPKTVKKSRVTRLTVARLYNLGSYEHIRYEITSDIPRGGSAQQTLMDTLRIIGLLRPLKKPYDLDAHRELLKKDASELSEYDKAHISEHASQVGEYDRKVQQRKEALAMLDDVGGVSVAKDKWDDEPPF